MVGFILPIIFYWKVIKGKKDKKKELIFPIIVMAFIIIISLLGIANFIIDNI